MKDGDDVDISDDCNIEGPSTMINQIGKDVQRDSHLNQPNLITLETVQLSMI